MPIKRQARQVPAHSEEKYSSCCSFGTFRARKCFFEGRELSILYPPVSFRELRTERLLVDNPSNIWRPSSLLSLAFLSTIHTTPHPCLFLFSFGRTHLCLPLPVPCGFVGLSVWPPPHCFLKRRSQEGVLRPRRCGQTSLGSGSPSSLCPSQAGSGFCLSLEGT